MLSNAELSSNLPLALDSFLAIVVVANVVTLSMPRRPPSTIVSTVNEK